MEEFVQEVRQYTQACAQAVVALQQQQQQSNQQQQQLQQQMQQQTAGSSLLAEGTKVLQKPEVWRPATLEEEIAGWPEWSFLFKSNVSYGDTGFQSDFEFVENNVNANLNVEDYAEPTRQRPRKLFSILCSYVKNRPLRLVRSVENNDGFKAWQALCRELQPSTRQRSLALAQTILSFPPFEKGKTLENLLAFEKLVEDYERITDIAYSNELKMGTLLRCLPQHLRQHLQLNLTSTTTYSQMRTAVINYEQTTSAWTPNKIMAQFNNNSTSANGQDQGPSPMDIDKVYANDKGGKSKGKYGRKGKKGGKKGSKGKPDGKSKGTDHKGKTKHKGKGHGHQNQQGKAAGPCFRCGKPGHIAADCWADVRAVQEHEQPQQPPLQEPSTAPPSSSGSSSTGTTSSTRIPGPPPRPTVPIRRVQTVKMDTPPGTPLCTIFDMRDEEDDELDIEFLVQVVHVRDGILHFNLTSDEPNFSHETFCIRTVSETYEAVLDLGADITVFPRHFLKQVQSHVVRCPTTQLRDAQGTFIPHGGERADLILVVFDSNGQEVRFQETCTFASVTQPLLCLGKFLRKKWALQEISGVFHLTNGSIEIPLRWKRNALMMEFSIFDEGRPQDYDCDIHDVRYVIDLTDQWRQALRNGPGWTLLDDGQAIHVSINATHFYDPSGEFDIDFWPYRSTLVRLDEDRFEIWEAGQAYAHRDRSESLQMLLPKTVLTMVHQIPVTLEFFGPNVDEHQPDASPGGGQFLAPAALTGAAQASGLEGPDGAPAPEPFQPAMDVDPLDACEPLDKLEENSAGDQPAQQVPQQPAQGMDAEAQVMVPPDAHEDLEVNGQRLTVDTPLRVIREACQWLSLSKSGSKQTCLDRIKAHLVQTRRSMEIEVAKQLHDEGIRRPDVQALPAPPSEAEIRLHQATHIPFAPWCEACVSCRSREDGPAKTHEAVLPVLSLDYMFTSASTGEPEANGLEDHMLVHLVGVEDHTKSCFALPCKSKGNVSLRSALVEIGRFANVYPKIVLRGDTEPAMKQLMKSVQQMRARSGLETKLEHVAPDPALHRGNLAERYIQTTRRLGNCLLATVQQNCKGQLSSTHRLRPWAYAHAAWLMSRFSVGKCGKTPFEIRNERSYAGRIVPFGSTIFAQYLPKKKQKGLPPWSKCIFLTKQADSDLHVVADSTGVHVARSVRRCADAWQLPVLMKIAGAPWDFTEERVEEKLKVTFQRNPEIVPLPSKREVSADASGKLSEAASEASVRDTLSEGEAASDPNSNGSLAGAAGDGIDVPAPGSPPPERIVTEVLFKSPQPHRLSPLRESSQREVLMDDDTPLKRLQEDTLERQAKASRTQETASPGRSRGATPEVARLSPPFFAGNISFVEAEVLVQNGDEVYPTGDVDVFMEEDSIFTDAAFEQQMDGDQESGPPDLTADELYELDCAARKLERDRLLQMGVLKPISAEAAEQLPELQWRYVEDWRFRENKWKRREGWLQKSSDSWTRRGSFFSVLLRCHAP